MEGNNFTELSKKLTKLLTKDEKKKNGIFFTPKSIRYKFMEKIKKMIDINKEYEIIEPSCGSCEFVNDILDSDILIKNLICIEKNKTIYNYLDKNYSRKDRVILINDDFINYESKTDLIIGNPPFFVIAKNQIPKIYENYFKGRPNIFLLFMIHSLHLLKENGLLCFVIPTSFLNSQYYNLLRWYIYENFMIRDIILFDENDFIDTDQSTLGIIIEKPNDNERENKIKNNKYTKIFEEFIIFFDEHTNLRIESLLFHSKTIKQLGMSVKTGTIVWNQCKNKLIDYDELNNKILIYNSNIVDGKFEIKSFKNDEKKQFIVTENYQEGPIIVVNRGNGNSKYKFTYCYLDKKINDKYYLVENHLNIISGPENLLKQILKSFEDQRTKEFIKLFCGNNGLSKTEIEKILPIYL
jgi:hypothetical protein